MSYLGKNQSCHVLTPLRKHALLPGAGAASAFQGEHLPVLAPSTRTDSFRPIRRSPRIYRISTIRYASRTTGRHASLPASRRRRITGVPCSSGWFRAAGVRCPGASSGWYAARVPADRRERLRRRVRCASAACWLPRRERRVPTTAPYAWRCAPRPAIRPAAAHAHGLPIVPATQAGDSGRNCNITLHLCMDTDAIMA